jgi:RNA 3'-terminal phosphate cyclase (ATP)
MVDVVYIDGSHGEGGGQIVRSSLSLSVVTGRAVTIDNIRAGREKPGLMRQHLAAVEAAAAICGADVTGAAVGSRTLTFQPRDVKAGAYHFRVGTAGSATLVLQTVLPALLNAGGPSQLVLEGGTHNPWAPPFDFLQRAFLPLVNRMGPRVDATLERPGFYPAGGGRFRVTIEPAPALAGFHLLERGEIRSRTVCARVANLPRHIAEREVATVLRKLEWDRGGETISRVEEVEAHGPGNVVMVELECERVTEVFTAFGRLGVRAEQVAKEVARETADYLAADVPVGPHLADQLLLPLAISAWQPGAGDRPRGGAFRTLPLTPHATTHLEIIQTFLDVAPQIESMAESECCTVRISGTPHESVLE